MELWLTRCTERIELVKNVIVNLARNIETGRNHHEWENLPIERYLQKDQDVKAVRNLHLWCTCSS